MGYNPFTNFLGHPSVVLQGGRFGSSCKWSDMAPIRFPVTNERPFGYLMSLVPYVLEFHVDLLLSFS